MGYPNANIFLAELYRRNTLNLGLPLLETKEKFIQAGQLEAHHDACH